MKRSGVWLAITKVKHWCVKSKGEDINLKYTPNGFIPMECSSGKEKRQILNLGPYDDGEARFIFTRFIIQL